MGGGRIGAGLRASGVSSRGGGIGGDSTGPGHDCGLSRPRACWRTAAADGGGRPRATDASMRIRADCLKLLGEAAAIPVDVADRPGLPQLRDTVDGPSRDQLRHYLASRVRPTGPPGRTRLLAMVGVVLDAGARVGEMCAMTLTDLADDLSTLRVERHPQARSVAPGGDGGYPARRGNAPRAAGLARRAIGDRRAAARRRGACALGFGAGQPRRAAGRGRNAGHPAAGHAAATARTATRLHQGGRRGQCRPRRLSRLATTSPPVRAAAACSVASRENRVTTPARLPSPSSGRCSSVFDERHARACYLLIGQLPTVPIECRKIRRRNPGGGVGSGPWCS